MNFQRVLNNQTAPSRRLFNNHLIENQEKKTSLDNLITNDLAFTLMNFELEAQTRNVIESDLPYYEKIFPIFPNRNFVEQQHLFLFDLDDEEILERVRRYVNGEISLQVKPHLCLHLNRIIGPFGFQEEDNFICAPALNCDLVGLVSIFNYSPNTIQPIISTEPELLNYLNTLENWHTNLVDSYSYKKSYALDRFQLYQLVKMATTNSIPSKIGSRKLLKFYSIIFNDRIQKQEFLSRFEAKKWDLVHDVNLTAKNLTLLNSWADGFLEERIGLVSRKFLVNILAQQQLRFLIPELYMRALILPLRCALSISNLRKLFLKLNGNVTQRFFLIRDVFMLREKMIEFGLDSARTINLDETVNEFWIPLGYISLAQRFNVRHSIEYLPRSAPSNFFKRLNIANFREDFTDPFSQISLFIDDLILNQELHINRLRITLAIMREFPHIDLTASPVLGQPDLNNVLNLNSYSMVNNNFNLHIQRKFPSKMSQVNGFLNLFANSNYFMSVKNPFIINRFIPKALCNQFRVCPALLSRIHLETDFEETVLELPAINIYLANINREASEMAKMIFVAYETVIIEAERFEENVSINTEISSLSENLNQSEGVNEQNVNIEIREVGGRDNFLDITISDSESSVSGNQNSRLL